MKPIRIASLVGLSLTIGCLLVLIGSSASATHQSKPEFAPSATITFYVVADSYIYSASPTQTHGSDTILYVGSPSASAGRVAGGPAWTNGDAGPDSEHSHADGAN